MTIEEFHNSLRELINIGQAQYYPPESIDVWINDAISDKFRKAYKHFEASQKITDTLGFYKAVSTALELDVASQAAIPADLFHVTNIEAVMTDGAKVGCELVTDSEFLIRKNSKAFAPSLIYPICRLIGTSKIEVYPIQIVDQQVVTTEGATHVILYYLREPLKAKYAYEVNPAGTGWIYDESGSTDVDWPTIDHPLIRDTALVYAGIALRDQALVGSKTVKMNQNEGE